jgi:hypothetical protein
MKDNQSLQSFVNYFETLQVRLRYHDKELKDLFIAKLTIPLQREIYKLGGANPPTTYVAAKELARNAENFLRNMPGKRIHQSDRQDHYRSNSTNLYRKRSAEDSTTQERCPAPLRNSAHFAEFRKLSKEEVERRKNQSLCMKCTSDTHMAWKCD